MSPYGGHKFQQEALEWRGIAPGDACERCQGAGTVLYSTGSTWRGGVSGQAATRDVCDKCWGSGSKSKPWPNRKEL